jgi:hypothetical protein
MFKNTNAAVGNINKAAGQINAVNNAAKNGQLGNMNRGMNATANTLMTANKQLNNASLQAKNLGLNNVSRSLKAAANKVKEAKLVEALKHTANAVNQMKTPKCSASPERNSVIISRV